MDGFVLVLLPGSSESKQTIYFLGLLILRPCLTVGALQPRAVTIWQSLKPHIWVSFCFVYLIALSGPLLADYCLSGVFLILAFHQKHAADSIATTIQKQMKKIGTNTLWICLKK